MTTELVETPFRFKTLPPPYERSGWGILNAEKELWTDEVFATAAQARQHVEKFWGGVPHRESIIAEFSYVRATRRVVVSPDPDKNGIRIILAKPCAVEPKHDH